MVMTYFTKSPGTCKVRQQRALEIEEPVLNDFCRFRVKSEPFMDQRRILNSKYFAKSLRLWASIKDAVAQCAHYLMGVVGSLRTHTFNCLIS